jgi:acetyltransferase
MSVHKLEPFFNPKRIALIGVTINPNSVGGKVLGNLVTGGFRGVVYPVNPQNEAVMGIPCYPDIANLPKTPDLGVICTAAEQVPNLVRKAGQAGIRALIVMSAGFGETGIAGRALEMQIIEEKNKFDGMRILGPNCLGLIVPGQSLNVSFAAGMPKPGHIGFISQSGALCTSVLDWALEAGIGFSHFVSIGNSIDVDFHDLIDYFGEDQSTESMLLYIESVRRARQFLTAARAFARSKPILAYKAGRFPESAKVAASHTGALASEDAVYDAAFQRVGIARIYDIGDIFDTVELISHAKYPRGPRLGIVSNAGGPAVMAVDALIEKHGVLTTLREQTLEQLDQILPPAWSHGNPVDVLGDATSKRFEKACQIVLQDPGIDALLTIVTPQAMTNPNQIARSVGKLVETTQKPILAAWLGGKTMREGMQMLTHQGVAAYQTPEQAIRAFMILVEYSRNLETLYETPREIPLQFFFDREKFRTNLMNSQYVSGNLLTELTAKLLLDAYGIETTTPHLATTQHEAMRISEELGFPVVLKIDSPDVIHKTDVGGVILDLENGKEVGGAFNRIVSTVKRKQPEARISGVSVQKMITSRNGLELILGIKKDAVFGTVMLVGMGGISAELLGDRALGFPPLNERLARRMLESLKIYPLLTGYRNLPPLAVDKLIEALIRLSYIAADYPEIEELDINPLLVTTREVVALDARIIIDPEKLGKSEETYSHLALRPYPEKYIKQIQLKDGTDVTLRPIKPEDEPLWLEMLSRCSKETIYSRFQHFFQWASHEVAVRFCFIDYSREIAIVAETVEDGERKLAGVVRLIADPDHESVEYAALIIDDYQKKELGSIITDHCLDIARKWNLKRIIAQTTTDNRPMISVFERRGFKIIHNERDSTVDAVLELDWN